MQRVLILFAPEAASLSAEIRARGGRVLHSYGPRVLVFEGDAELIRSVGERPGVLGVHAGPVEGNLPPLDETGRMGIDAWNAALSPSFRQAKRLRKGEGLPWDTNED